MKEEEYLQTLTEQIQNKRAKKLVEEEIKNHIEEQTKSYEAEGMPYETAVEEAVRQMGNPVDTGVALNKIHRAKMPWLMILLALGLTVISSVMQSIMFRAGTNIDYEPCNAVFYNGISFLIALAVLYVDYSFIARYVYQIYGIYLVVLTVWVSVIPSHRYASTSLYGYGILMLYPLIFAGIIYRNRNRGKKGMLTSLFYSIAVLICYWFAGKVIAGSGLSAPAIAETTLIVALMLAVAIWKGIFGKEKKKYAAALAGVGGICGIIGVLGLSVFSRNDYLIARIRNIFAPFLPAASQYEQDMSYYTIKIRESIANASLWGNRSFVPENLTMENVNTLLLNGIFTYFGTIAGWVTVALLLTFVIFTLRVSLRQSNRISLLLGTACSMGLLVRVLVYIGINFGCSLWWTTLIPFFSFGKTSAVVNGIYVGLLLAVYRNSNILKEDRTGKRVKLTFEIQEE